MNGGIKEKGEGKREKRGEERRWIRKRGKLKENREKRRKLTGKKCQYKVGTKEIKSAIWC